MEAVGTVVGLVSLGVSVCQGLLAYYSSWRDSETTVDSMYTSVETVTKTLMFLKITIESKRFGNDAIAQAKRSVTSCEQGIRALEEKLKEVRGTPLTDGWKEKTKAHFRKALFPFKEPTLMALRDTANNLQDHLALALSAFQIDASGISLQKLDALTDQLVVVSQTIDGIKGQVAEISTGSGRFGEDVKKISSDVDSLAAAQQAKYLSTIYNWLSPLAGRFENKQQDTFGVTGRQDGIGRWLLQRDEFGKWVNCKGTKSLWCSGLPGAGKTVLASFIIDHLQKTFEGSDVGIAYAYCSYKEAKDQTPLNLLADLLRQLLLQRPLLSDEIKSLYESHIPKKTRPTILECSVLLKAAVADFSKVIIVIDALDECPEADDHRDIFTTEIYNLQPEISLLVTSRNISSISSKFKDDYRVEIRASDEDMTGYLQDRLSMTSRLSVYTNKDPGLRDTITSTIVAKAQGMFLLARLHFDSLATKTNVRQIKAALKSLPAELSTTYDEVMSRINSQDDDHAYLARKVLSWIFHAARPLKVHEIQHALAVELEDRDIEEDGITDPSNLLSVCAGIATIQKESQIMSLVHYTTQDYFERKGAEFFDYGHTEIAQVCLQYLLFDAFGGGPCLGDREMEDRLKKYHLFSYAAQNWGNHARETSTEEETLHELAMEFLGDGKRILSFVQVMHLPRNRFKGYTQRFPTEVTGLHVAAFFGLETIAKDILRQGSSVEIGDSRGWTAMHHAAWSGQEGVLALLLQENKEARLDVADHDGRTLLSLAAERGHVKVISLLLEEGADARKADGKGQTPLHLAARDGQEAAVKLLLAQDGGVNLIDAQGWTALHFAAQYGFAEVVKLLLKEGSDMSKFGGRGWTAMHLAAQNGQVPTLKLILDNGNDVNTLNSDGWSAMDEAAAGGHLDAMRVLLSRGINVNSLDKSGNCALHWAAPLGKQPVIRMLLENGANPNTPNSGGATPLHHAVGEGLEATVGLLLEFSASAAAANMYGWTALHIAAFMGHAKIIGLLQDHGADIDAQDDLGWTPLHVAVLGEKYASVMVLLDRDADPTIESLAGLSPKDLAAVAIDSDPRVRGWRRVAHLRRAGSQVITGLRLAVVDYGFSGVQALIESGVDVNGTDPGERTALRVAAAMNLLDVAELLLEHGADVNKRGITGITPLSAARSSPMVRLLKRWGAIRRKSDAPMFCKDADDSDDDVIDDDPNEELRRRVLRTAIFKLLCDREASAAEQSVLLDQKEGISRVRRVDSEVDVELGGGKGIGDGGMVVITESVAVGDKEEI